MKAMLMAVAMLTGCLDEVEPMTDSTSEIVLERCGDICPDMRTWIKISLSDGKQTVTSYSCPVEGELYPVICKP